MSQPISKTFVSVNLSICGEDCEQEAEVSYLYERAFGPIVERGSGIPISPPEPENAEILSVKVPCAGKIIGTAKPSMHEIIHLLTDKQIEAIVTEVLEQRV